MKINNINSKEIEELVNKIKLPCRGRIEIIHGDKVNVIEFHSHPAGGWKETTQHSLVCDETFSTFPEYKVLLPALKKIREILNES